MCKFVVGEVVKSIKGRDKDSLYMIYKLEKNFAMLVNGDNKTKDNPKSKNLNHIISCNVVLQNISNKISKNQNVFDAEIYSCIKNSL